MTHFHCVRVYYEDTDLAGIVYYANYFRFIERARTEFIRTTGIDQTELRAERGIVFAVRRLVAEFIAPARFDDLLRVSTSVQTVSGASIQLRQDISRDGLMIFSATVMLACVKDDGKPARLPPEVRVKLAQPAG